MPSFGYQAPRTLGELAACLAQADADTRILGGGTDLVIQLRERGIHRGTLLDITRVAGLDRVERDGGWLRIGANVTYTGLAEHPLVAALVPCLGEMAAQVGSVQVRNAARLPGNIANASPAGDSIATLLALDGQVELLDGKGALRMLPVAEAVTGIGRTALARDEAIVAVRVPCPGPQARSAYGKIGMGARRQVVIANASLTVALEYPAAGGSIRASRVAIGSAAPVAYRARSAEALLDGRRPSRELGRLLAACLCQEVQASIQGNPLFMHKLNDIQGLALDLFERLFGDVLQEQP
jgi:CO/xanthine dehydrogenase FAD-binding subunit